MSDLDRHFMSRQKAIARTGAQDSRRTYVLDPYESVRDHLSGYTGSDVHRVLDGELDELMRLGLAALK